MKNKLNLNLATKKYMTLKTKNGNYKELLEGEMPKTIWTMKIKPTKKS